MWDLQMQAFCRSFQPFGGIQPIFLSLVGIFVTAVIVFVVRRKVFHEHLIQNVLIAFAGGICTWLFVFAYYAVWAIPRETNARAMHVSIPKTHAPIPPPFWNVRFPRKALEALDPLVISPQRVSFVERQSSPTSEPGPDYFQTFTFRLTNRTDQILYMVGFKLRIYSDDLSGDDFEVHLAPGSRKPIGDTQGAAQHLADVQALLAKDSENRPLFLFYMSRLAGHDFREVTLTRIKDGTATVTGEIGSCSAKPQSQEVHDSIVGFPFNPVETITDVRQIFLVVDVSKDPESGRPFGGASVPLLTGSGDCSLAKN